MKQLLERQENLDLKQAMVTDPPADGRAGLRRVTRLGAVYRVKACVIASGTYLDARVITGDCAYASGPDGMQAGIDLTEAFAWAAYAPVQDRHAAARQPPLDRCGRRWSCSRATRRPSRSRFPRRRRRKTSAVCYLTYTNEKTHRHHPRQP